MLRRLDAGRAMRVTLLEKKARSGIDSSLSQRERSTFVTSGVQASKSGPKTDTPGGNASSPRRLSVCEQKCAPTRCRHDRCAISRRSSWSAPLAKRSPIEWTLGGSATAATPEPRRQSSGNAVSPVAREKSAPRRARVFLQKPLPMLVTDAGSATGPFSFFALAQKSEPMVVRDRRCPTSSCRRAAAPAKHPSPTVVIDGGSLTSCSVEWSLPKSLGRDVTPDAAVRSALEHPRVAVAKRAAASGEPARNASMT
mmetsp:Transcript_32910/g.101706  ORF Transcript_32910/g.101706 Transcript_32910/m.101706 type:complete len:254 (-) Transcript_32910:46-807(-)